MSGQQERRAGPDRPDEPDLPDTTLTIARLAGPERPEANGHHRVGLAGPGPSSPGQADANAPGPAWAARAAEAGPPTGRDAADVPAQPERIPRRYVDTGSRPEPGSWTDLRQRLERLPYGHPSSPYHVDGERKPPPPRLRHLELAPPARGTPARPAPSEPPVPELAASERDRPGATLSQQTTAPVPSGPAASAAGPDAHAPARLDPPALAPSADAPAALDPLTPAASRYAQAPADPLTPLPSVFVPAPPDPLTPTAARHAPAPTDPLAPRYSAAPPDPPTPTPSTHATARPDPLTPSPPRHAAVQPDSLAPLPAAPDSARPDRSPRATVSSASFTPAPRETGRGEPPRAASTPGEYRDASTPARDARLGREPVLVGDAARLAPDGSWSWGAARLTREQVRIAEDAHDMFRTAEGRSLLGYDRGNGLTAAMRRVEQQAAPGRLAPGTDERALLASDVFKARFADMLQRHPDWTPEQLSRRVPGTLTYVFVLEAENYADDIKDIEEAMQLHGFRLQARKNSWHSEANRGVFTIWHEPRYGLPFQVQFHTAASLQAQRLARPPAALTSDRQVPPTQAATRT